MELEGSLKAFSLPEVLQFLSMSKMTGTLAVSSGKRTIKVMIRDGKIVNTSSLNLSRKLGTLLIHHNRLQRHQLEEALRRQQRDKKLLGEILVDEKYISKADLHRTIEMQLEEEVWDLFRLGEGDFKFEHGKPGPEEVIVEIDIEPLIMEGTRQLDEWHRIIKNIPNDDYVVELSPLDGDFEKLPLTDSEWTVLSYINGRASIGSIVARSTLGKFETYQALNSFLAAGMVRMVSPEEARKRQDHAQDPEEFVIPMGGGAPTGLGEVKKAVGSPNLMNKYFKGDDEMGESEIAGKLVFMSCVGQVSEYLTLFMDRLWKMPEFQPGPEDAAFCERRWTRLLHEYIRADLIEVRGNRINALALERFIGFFGGIAASLRSTYEDSIDALRALNEAVLAFAAERIGMKAVATVRDQVVAEFRTKSVVRFPEDSDSLESYMGA